ncbi:DUF3575 domain-containing protein [Pedobacter sp. Leaf170]|uniref:DUF3575 domain-containing protein n=1 Tax=Pedobacter sp. Leaf170 TaxID=2876558 RepID=UPI001E486697|nr:DUF3575 domain-containing protein [Pedobacter sp. Leaf170]
MKKLTLSLLFLALITTTVFGQDLGKNVIKLNLLSLPLKNINVEYERGLTKKISAALGVRYMSKGSIPFSNSIAELLNDDADNWNERIKSAKLGNTAVTATVRFYLGEGNLKGFYIAPFGRYAKYSASLDYPFEVDNGATSYSQDISLAGDLTTITVGILLGSQFNLGKHLTLDWWILGPQYGSSDGSISGKKPLTANEQQALREQLEEIKDLPIVKANYTVDANGAVVDFKGPWAGIRAGLCLGFRF